MAWWGAKLRMIVLIEGEGAVDVNDGVFLVQADDFDGAFQAALDVGRQREHEYLNAEGRRVRWRLSEVLQIHGGIDSDRPLDGQEVMTELGGVTPPDLPFDAEFAPDESRPSSS